jgi:hypothetical protein
MYVKLFDRMIKSSVWDESATTRIAWVTMLLLSDQDGTVYGTPTALARSANLTVEQMTTALEIFQNPDACSTSTGDDGRRVLQIAPNQWHVVNYSKYREMADASVQREQTRIRVQNYRKRKDVTPGNVTVTPVTVGNGQKRQAEAEAEANLSDPADPHPSKDGHDAMDVFAHWQKVHGYAKAKLDDKRRAMINRILRKYTVADCCKAIDGCAKSSYHMGENPAGKKYNGIDLILRDGAHVDQFMATDDNPPEPKPMQFPEARRMTASELALSKLGGWSE